MPYFQLNGRAISRQDADCPVEITSASSVCNSSGSATDPNDAKKTFFATAKDGSGGQVVLTGITDKGYKLVTADASSDLSELKDQDVFNGKLKVTNNGNEITQKYCYRGLAPIGTKLTELTPGTYHLYRDDMNQVYINTVNGSSESFTINLSQSYANRQVFTFAMVGGGGGGSGGDSNWNTNGGSGGGGACAALYTIKFLKQDTHYKLKIVVGSGGGAGGKNSGGSGGGATYIEGGIADSNYNIISSGKINCPGGKGAGGVSSPGGRSDAASSTFTDATGIKVIKSQYLQGQSGGNKAAGTGFDPVAIYNFTVSPKYADYYWGNISGGDRASGDAYGGGGGASAFGGGKHAVDSGIAGHISKSGYDMLRLDTTCAGGGGGGGYASSWFNGTSGSGGYNGACAIYY